MSLVYRSAANVLGDFLARKGGIKTLSYSDKIAAKNKKSVYALVVETLKYQKYVEEVIQVTNLQVNLNKLRFSLDRNLLLVLTYELVFGKGKFQGGGEVQKLLLKRKNALQAALTRIKIRHGASCNSDLLPKEIREVVQVPRYARVNLLRSSMQQAEAELKELGFAKVPRPREGLLAGEGDKQRVCLPALSSGQYYCDEIVPDLLVFPPGTQLHASALVKEGRLLLQDKASCFPAVVLGPSAGWRCIDACAAPGNKTSHLAALLSRAHANAANAANAAAEGGIHAFEINAKRCSLLRKMLSKAGADALVRVVEGSFLEADSADEAYAGVNAILLDPTCSGSGMTHRIDHWIREQQAAQQAEKVPDRDPKDRRRPGDDKSKTHNNSRMKKRKRQGGHESKHDAKMEAERSDVMNDKEGERTKRQLPQAEAERVLALAEFQKNMIIHAMKFPAVETIVYSTCSIHQEENEKVVAAVLSSPEGQAFSLAHVLPSWHRRGLKLDELPDGWKCVRADAKLDLTNGFFVAKMTRVTAETENQQTALSGSKPLSTTTSTTRKKKKKKKKKKKPTATSKCR